MSRSKKGSPKLGSVPSAFKKVQLRSQKHKQKQSDRKLIVYPDHEMLLKFKKSHRWEYF